MDEYVFVDMSAFIFLRYVQCTYICSLFGNNKWSMRQTHVVNKLGGGGLLFQRTVHSMSYLSYVYMPIRELTHT